MDDNEVPESEDIEAQYDNSPDEDIANLRDEENLGEDEFDARQGFNYPEQQYKDSITKFYRHIISLMIPKKVVRVANFTHKEARNALIYLNVADYNRIENCDTVASFIDSKAIVEAAVSMGKKGFIVTNIMTQRRIVQRQSDKGSGVGSWNKPKEGGQK